MLTRIDKKNIGIKPFVSSCCKADMILPDWDKADQMGSLWRAYAFYICKKCGKTCEPYKKTLK